MKNLKFYICTVLIALTSSAGFAKGYLSKVEITALAFQSNHLMIYAANWNNPNGCTKANAVLLKKDDPNFDQAYSLILAAYLSGKALSGYSDGCETWDGQTYNTIRGSKYLVVQ